MVNYGYGPGMPHWKDEKKNELAEALRKLLVEKNFSHNDKIETQETGMLHEHPSEPYIEIDGLYEGVRIRKITNLSEKQCDELITAAEEIYLAIMK